MSYEQNTRTMSNFSRPVETGKEYTVDITDAGRYVEGVARIGGLIIFVKNAKDGDKKRRRVHTYCGGSRYDLGFCL
jgi:predicted RNA-binding protein with TRAM domain